MSLTRDDLVRWLQSALRANEHDWTNEADRDKESSRLQSIFDLALSALTARSEGLLEWLDNNTTYYDVKQPAVEAPNVPVLAKVSKRIWYHATDDQLSYPFSDVIRAALSPRETDAKEQPGEQNATVTAAQKAQMIEALYYELLYAVSNKYPGETRHQTALRYIRRAEAPSDIESQAANDPPPPERP